MISNAQNSFFHSPDDLKKRFKETKSGAYIFCGTEDYLTDRWLEQFRKAVRDGGFYELDRVKLDFTAGMNRSVLSESTKTSDADAVIGELAMPPVGEMRLIEVNALDIEKLGDKDVKKLCTAVSEMMPGTILILVYYGGSLVLDKKKAEKKLFKTLSESFYIVDFKPMAKAKIIKWLSGLFTAENVTCGEDNMELIISRSENMLGMSSAVSLMCACIRERGDNAVTRDDVLSFTGGNEEAEIYEFTESVLNGNRQEAFRALSVLRDKKTDPIVINASLGRAVWNLCSVKYSSDQNELLRSSGLASWQANKMRPAADKKSRKFFEDASKLILECDKRMKSDSSDPELLVYALTEKLVGMK